MLSLRRQLYRGIVNWKAFLPLLLEMQERECSFAIEQNFVNQSTYRQFVFTSEHKGTHLRHASGDTCLKEVYKFTMVGLPHNQKPQKTRTAAMTLLKCTNGRKVL